MSETQNERQFYIGLDLGYDRALISFFSPDMDDAETVSTAAGEERYQIPTAICRTSSGKYFYGEEAIRRRDESGVRFQDRIYYRALFEDAPESAENLYLFVRRLLDFRKRFGCREGDAYYLSIAVPEVTAASVKVLRNLQKQLELPDDAFRILDYKESFFDYTIMQEATVWKHSVALYQFTEDRLLFYLLYMNRTGRQMHAYIAVKERSVSKELLEDKKRLDHYFSRVLRDDFQKRIVSGVFLIGDGFDGDWFSETISALGPNRRAFIGKNLYTRGACLGGYRLTNIEDDRLIYHCDYRIFTDVQLQVLDHQEVTGVPLVEYRKNWFDSKVSYTLLYNGEAALNVAVGGSDRTLTEHHLELNDYPNREAKTSRISVTASPIDADTLQIRVKELGLGVFYDASGRSWDFEIPIRH